MTKLTAIHLGLAALILVTLTACQARTPSNAETRAAYFIKRNITVRGKGTNPFPATVENIHAGRQAFSNYCMVCHGLDGQNTGVPFADRMSPPVPLLNEAHVQSFSDAQLKSVIENGIFPSGMPASRGTLNEDEIWQIVTYLRHLPPKGSLGEPAIYGGTP
jgi:mono/diheme cytochrome c family protein